MSQYDFLFMQNTHATLVEYSEKYINLAKGNLFTVDASRNPIVVPIGTNDYMLLADSTTASGFRWQAIPSLIQLHDQNTDTGTTATSFSINSGAFNVNIAAESASKVGIKVAGGTYADLQAKDGIFNKITVAGDPGAANEVANKAYVDSLLASANAMVFKNNITIAAATALTLFNIGWTYRLSDSGSFLGSPVEAGDLIIAIANRTIGATVSTDWTIAQTNTDGVVIGPATSVDNYVALFSGTSGKLLKQGTGALGSAAYVNTGTFATSAQGTTADNAIPKAAYTAADTVLVGTGAGTYTPIIMGASQFFGKHSTGTARNLTKAEALAILNVADGAQANVASNLAVGTVTATAAPVTNSNGTGFSLPIATDILAGLMNAADHTKLTGIAAGAQVNVPSNLAVGTVTATGVPITNSNGTGFTLPEATDALAGLISAADHTKLTGIATGATNNTKATAAEINTGTDDVKFATALAIAGSTIVKGPGSSVANRIAVFSNTTGKLLADGGKLIADLMTNWVAAPATKISTGTVGDKAYDTNYFYICTATNVWKRTVLATNW